MVNSTSLGGSWTRRASATSSLGVTARTGIRTALAGDTTSGFDDVVFAGGGLRYSHRINPRNSANIGLDTFFEDDGAVQELTSGVTAGWSWQLTRNISANLAYSFRWRTSDVGDTDSHRVSLTFSRPFTLIP